MFDTIIVTRFVNGVLESILFNGPNARVAAREFVKNCKEPHTTNIFSVPTLDRLTFSIAAPDDQI